MESTKENAKAKPEVMEGAEDGGACKEGGEEPKSRTKEEPRKTKRKSRTERLKEELEVARAEAEENRDRWLRSIAELENFKKRTKREAETWIRTANDHLVLNLLPVLDSFERALDHPPEEGGSESFRAGVELIFTQLKGALEKAGIDSIESVGHPFDPNLHDAMMQMESEEYDSGVVLEEIERGYTLNDRVIRHTKVVVNK